MIVMKFGGSSVANRAQVEKVMEIVKGRLDKGPVVVSSAHKGITDALINSAKAAVHRQYNLPDVIDLQSEIASSMGCPPEILAELFQEVSDLLRGIGLVRELSPRSLDYMASFGERMAVRVIADFFTRQGLPAKAFDVWDLGFITDANFGMARPLPDYAERMKNAFACMVEPGVVPVITGFVGKTETGDITTVGRNGSDLTATLVGAAIEAEEVEIWTDTDGVMTADPSMVPQAKNIPEMSFSEAAELAHFGSRVLHPATLLPAMEREIPVRVLNTNRPEHPGTVINREGPLQTQGVTSVAYKENQVVVTITSARMLEQAGFVARVFEVLAEREVVVDMIATSEISVSFTTDRLAHIERALPELEKYGSCDIREGKTVLVVVGRDLGRCRGLSADILSAVASSGTQIDMLSFGMGAINFSLVVDDSDVKKAVTTLHQVLFEK
ncbi:MAG: aspartate kinase [Deltaproteobacteria bacterium]|nr:aspartate kinase [Deltaproteobacteria bacterium]